MVSFELGKEIEKDVFSSLSPQEESHLVSWKNWIKDHRITGSPDHWIKDQGSRIKDQGLPDPGLPDQGLRIKDHP